MCQAVDFSSLEEGGSSPGKRVFAYQESLDKRSGPLNEGIRSTIPKSRNLFLSLILLFVTTVAAQELTPPGFTKDFEEGNLRGWTSEGEAFRNQPTRDDNPTARGRGQSPNHQGRYWIGTFENYQGRRGQRPGSVQGDPPTGVLTSAPFTIPSGQLGFLIGGGSAFETRVELNVLDPIEGRIRKMHASGRNAETMRRVTWNLDGIAGNTGQLRIVDQSSGGWGHINVDDFVFSSAEMTAVRAVERIPEGRFGREDPGRLATVIPSRLSAVLKVEPTSSHPGEPVAFVASIRVLETDSRARRKLPAIYKIHFGDEKVSGWTDDPQFSHAYAHPGHFNAFVEIQPNGIDGETIRSEVVPIEIGPLTRQLHLKVGDKPPFGIDQPVPFFLQIAPPRPNDSFRFDLGDRTRTSWQTEPNTVHRYSRPGHYRVVAWARGQEEKDPIESNPLEVAIVSVRLEADRNAIDEGGSATFAAFFEPSVKAANFRYQFHFGDGGTTRWLERSEAQHRYSTAGSFGAFVEVRPHLGKDEVLRSEPVPVEVRSIPHQLHLTLGGSSPFWIGQPVPISLELDPPRPGGSFRFDFGDRSNTDWQSERAIEHAYAQPGHYRVVALARGAEDKRPLSSEPLELTVSGIRLESDRAVLRSGETVSFSASLHPPANAPGLRYRYFFGDGNEVLSARPTVQHHYEGSGAFRASVEAIWNDLISPPSESVHLTVSPEFIPILRANPPRAAPGEPVELTIFGPSAGVSAEYNFHFGDGEESGWTQALGTRYTYAQAGSYEAIVETRLASGSPLRSAPVYIHIRKRLPWPLFAGGVLLLVAFVTWIWRPWKPRENPDSSPEQKTSEKSANAPRFVVHSHLDRGTQSIAPGSRLRLGAEMRLRAIRDPGQVTAQHSEGNGGQIRTRTIDP